MTGFGIGIVQIIRGVIQAKKPGSFVEEPAAQSLDSAMLPRVGSDLVQIHCRFCRQTFLTTEAAIAAQQCDLCKQTGGLVNPPVAAQDEGTVSSPVSSATTRWNVRAATQVRGFNALIASS